MIIGTMVWCTITATITILGQPVTDHETAAKGRITKIEGEYLRVDFSEYARKQQYQGQYYDIRLEEALCVKADKD